MSLWRPSAPDLPDEVITHVISMTERMCMLSVDGDPLDLDGKPIGGVMPQPHAEVRVRAVVESACSLLSTFARTYQHGHDPSEAERMASMGEDFPGTSGGLVQRMSGPPAYNVHYGSAPLLAEKERA